MHQREEHVAVALEREQAVDARLGQRLGPGRGGRQVAGETDVDAHGGDRSWEAVAVVYPVVIEGEGVVLREFVDDDLDGLLETLGDPDVVRHVSLRVLDEAGASRMLDRITARALAEPRGGYTLAIVARGEETPCGTISLTIDAPEHHRCEIGFAVAKRVWGRGLATEAVRLMIDFGFDHVGARRIWAVCTPDNPASAKVLARCGMRHEGTLRSDLLIDGVWSDSQMWAVLSPPGDPADPPGLLPRRDPAG